MAKLGHTGSAKEDKARGWGRQERQGGRGGKGTQPGAEHRQRQTRFAAATIARYELSSQQIFGETNDLQRGPQLTLSPSTSYSL